MIGRGTIAYAGTVAIGNMIDEASRLTPMR